MQDVARLAGLLAAKDLDAARSLAASLEQTHPAAAGAARAAIEMQASDPARARVQIAALYMMAGDRTQALDSARAALTLAPSPAVRGSVGALLVAAGLFTEARPILEGVLAESPRDREAIQNLSMVRYRLGDLEGAIRGYAHAFDLDPTDPTPLHNLMELLADAGKWMGALAALGMVRSGEPPPEVAFALDLSALQIVQHVASAYPAPGLDQEADSTVRDLLTHVKTRNARAQLVAARALFDVGRLPEARTLVQQIARNAMLQPAERADLSYVEGLLAEHDEYKTTAIEKYTKAVAGDPARVDAATNAVSLLLEQGTPEALKQIGALLDALDATVRRNASPLAFNEARYLNKLGRTDEARVCLQRVIDLEGGNGPLAELARRALQELGT